MNLMDCYRHAAYMFNMNSIAMLARHEPPEKIEAYRREFEAFFEKYLEHDKKRGCVG